MITNLEEFYKNVQNPILDEKNFDALINAYARHNFLDPEYKGNIGNVYSKRSNVYSPDDFNTFYATIFNYWKKHLTTTEIPNTSSLYSLQQYFKNVKDVTTWKDAVAAFPHKRRTKYLNKLFDISQNSQQISSVDIHEQNGNTEYAPFDVEHILYVNVDLDHLHKFATKFLDKCEEKNIPYLFDVRTKWGCDNSFTINSDSEHLLDYYQILQEIVKEDDDLKKHIYHPPVFSGVVDGWIGYESANHANSKQTEEITHHILSKGFKRMVADEPKVPLKQDDEKMTLVDLVSSNVVYEKIDYLSKLDRKQLKDYFGLKPRDLKNKNLLNLMFSEIKKELLSGVSNKSFKFNNIEISYRKRSKQSLTISHKDLERSLAASFKNITKNYPATKKPLQTAILKRAGQKGIDSDKFCMRKEDKGLFSRIFKKKKDTTQKVKKSTKQDDSTKRSKPVNTTNSNNKTKSDSSTIYRFTKDQIIQDLPIKSDEQSSYQSAMTEEEIRESRIKLGFINPQMDNTTTYSLKKNQIIQDLPIYSKEESRYQGVMTEEEIKISREKIKTYCKK